MVNIDSVIHYEEEFLEVVEEEAEENLQAAYFLKASLQLLAKEEKWMYQIVDMYASIHHDFPLKEEVILSGSLKKVREEWWWLVCSVWCGSRVEV